MKAAFLFLRKKKKHRHGLQDYRKCHLQYKLGGRLNFYTCGSMSICPTSLFSLPYLGVYSFSVNKVIE